MNFEILKMGQHFQNWAKVKNFRGARHMRVKCASGARESCAGIRASFTNGAYASNVRHMRGKYAWILCRNLRVIYKWRVRVKCAWYARQVRVNLVPESARHLQMTRTRILRVDTRDLPEANSLPLCFTIFWPVETSNKVSWKTNIRTWHSDAVVCHSVLL